MNTAEQDKQVADAEELLGDRLGKTGFAKGLFFGQFFGNRLPAVRALTTDSDTADLVERLKLFCQEKIDPDAIDRNAEIPPHVIRGLGELGLLGACLPKGCGGNGMSQTSYCRLIQVLGGALWQHRTIR